MLFLSSLSLGEYIFAIIVSLICIGMFIFLVLISIERILISLFDIIDEIYYFFTGKQILFRYRIFYKKLSPSNKQALWNFSTYYRKLPLELQRTFEHRVATFCKTKQFIGREDFLIDSEKKICIASVAIKLTFGYRRFNYDHFRKIIVYPDAYYSPRTDEYHLGEASLGGYIALSWKSFIEGEDIPDDNRNLGLHEFAHALYINEIVGNENHIFNNWIAKWKLGMNKLKPVVEKMEIFREYAFTNEMEFFAVAVEHFLKPRKNFKRNCQMHLRLCLNY